MPDTPEQTKKKEQILAAINNKFNEYYDKELSELVTMLKGLNWTKIKTFLKNKVQERADGAQASSDGNLAEKTFYDTLKTDIDSF